jgi:hypothetical protein
MLSERTIINGLLLLGGMILGPYLIILTLQPDEIPLLSFCGLVFLFCIFFFVRDRIVFFPVIGGYFSGTLNFLPLGFTLVEVFSLITIGYYLVNYVALKRKPITMGPRYFLFPILVIGAIVLYHDHDAGLKVLGSSSEGARPGLLIIVSIITYFCAINIPSPSTAFTRRLPLYCFGVALIASVPFLLTTYIPGLAPYVYYVSGNVNLSAYAQSIEGAESGDVERNGALAGLGGTLQAILVCYYPLNTWWHPRRWILIVLSCLCFYFVLASGYRNNLLGYLIFILFAVLCYSRWRILFLLPLMAILPLMVIAIQNDHIGGIKLPDPVQRSMSFLPGNWDPNIVASADASNDFRHNIYRVYKSEYLSKSPWIGNGFTFNPGEPEGYEAMARTPGVGDSEYYITKAFIVSKNFHTGWISLYDAVGIIGGLAFVFLNLAIIWAAGRFVFIKNVDIHSQLFPVKVWLFCNLTGGLIGYFATFGSFNQAFISMCGNVIILVHLERMQRQDTFTATVSPSSQMPLTSPSQAKAFSPLGTS